jgi:hypothetical protein
LTRAGRYPDPHHDKRLLRSKRSVLSAGEIALVAIIGPAEGIGCRHLDEVVLDLGGAEQFHEFGPQFRVIAARACHIGITLGRRAVERFGEKVFQPIPAFRASRILAFTLLFHMSGARAHEFPAKPRARHRPLSLDRGRRHAECVGGFLQGHAGEVAHLDDLHLSRVDPGELTQGGINSHQVLVTFAVIVAVLQRHWRRHRIRPFSMAIAHLVQAHHLGAAAALRGSPRTRVIHEDPTHEAGRESEELCAVLPIDRLLANEPQECLVDEGGALDGVVPSLVTQMTLRQPTKFVVQHHRQLRKS